MAEIVRIIADATVPPGMFSLGGVRVVDVDDAALGRELRTVEVRCHGVEEADRMRALVDADPALELDAVTVCEHDYGRWAGVIRVCRRCDHIDHRPRQ